MFRRGRVFLSLAARWFHGLAMRVLLSALSYLSFLGPVALTLAGLVAAVIMLTDLTHLFTGGYKTSSECPPLACPAFLPP